MKDLKIEIPSGYVIDEENSNLLQGVIKFKKIEIKTFNDLIKSKQKVNGCWIDENSDIRNGIFYKMSESDKNAFIDKKHAKSALAMAQISQLMPYYGGAITDEEWSDINLDKHILRRISNRVEAVTMTATFSLLAFHTEWQRDAFYNINNRLVKDYLMID